MHTFSIYNRNILKYKLNMLNYIFTLVIINNLNLAKLALKTYAFSA